MTDTLQKRIENYRARAYRILPNDRVQNKKEAVDFIDQRGAILFHPSKDIEFPSLWAARAGNRPVPNEHDDPGHITWQWKDELLGERRCYYGRLLGQKMTFISLAMLPYFFRLSNNIEYENDYLFQYQKGEMSFEAKRMYEALLNEGPMDTLQLRKQAGLSGRENQYRYTKNLNWLQSEMMLIPVGIAAVGRWNYAFILDILPRYYPDLPDKSLALKLPDARDEILKHILLAVGAIDERAVRKLLRWTPRSIQSSAKQLEDNGFMRSAVKIDGASQPQLVLSELLI